MAAKKSEATGWGFKLVGVLLSVVVVAGVFTASFSSAGNEINSIVRALIPPIIGLLVAMVLGRFSALSNKRWQIYIAIMFAVAVFIVLRIYRLV